MIRQIVLVGVIALCVTGNTLADDIFSAARRGDLFTVNHYLEKDPENIRAVDEAGYTALHWAGIRGRWEVFELLVRRGAPPNLQGADGGTPLHWACHHDRPDMIRLLLDAGADPDVRNHWGRVPLHVAARRGCIQVAGVLLDHGADPKAATKEGWNALHVAYKAGHRDMISLLKTRDVPADGKDADGKLPSDYEFTRPAPVPVDPDSLHRYVGRYALGPDAVVKVWEDGGKLLLMEFAPDEIYPVGSDAFYCVQEPWKVRFLRDGDGGVNGIELDYLRRTVRGEKMPERSYAGSESCGECHREVYLHWLQTRHASAYWRLATDWARVLISFQEKYSDIESPREEWRCLKCHVAGTQDFEGTFADNFRQEEGVGCEACHGPGSLHGEPGFVAAPGDRACRNCHQTEDFNIEVKLPEIAHPR